MTAPIMVTDRAAQEVKRIVAENPPEEGQKVRLRLKIVGGGCSGFQHKLELDADANEKLDEVYEVNDIGVVIDKRSLIYAEGATIDFHDDLNIRGFSVENPKSTSKCGCGSSFSM